MHTQRKPAAPANQFSYSVWRDDVDAAAKDMVSASARVLALVVAARDVVELDTVREALQHAFGEAYADLHGVTFDLALTAKSVKNRISDALAVFRAETMPTALPSNLQHAAALCRKLNRKAAEPANEEPVEDQDEEGLGLTEAPQQVDASHAALKAMMASLAVLKSVSKSHTLTSLLEDLADLVEEVGNELDAEDM